MGSMIAGAATMKLANLFPMSPTSPETAPTPSWLETEPLIVISNYVPEMFMVRAGRGPAWLPEVYRKVNSEEAIRKLRDLGVTAAIIPCFVGFGLEAEGEEIADSRKQAALLRRHGIRVGVYIGSTIFYETFLLEKPEAKEWFVQDYLGKPVIYPRQTFRKRVYFMHPGYQEYIKRVLRLAIEELKVDFFSFDNTSIQAEPAIFQHPLAVEDFRTFLRERYTPTGLKQRLGIRDARYVEPPRPDWPITTIDDPLWQEWTEFRCQQLARYYGEMKEFIRGLNPNVAISANPSTGMSGRNTIWNQGVDYPTLLPQMDLMWSEEGDPASVTAEGILVSKIRTYKMATSLRKRILTYTTRCLAGDGTFQVEMPGGKVEMAESMANNRQSLGNVGGGFAGYNIKSVIWGTSEEDRKYIRFFREHFDLYRGVETVADVAVFYSHASMGFNSDRPAVSFMLFTQVLIQAKIPFSLIFDEQLTNLSSYRVLVLADQECLSDEQLGLIRAYVEQGGGLVATEHTSLYTEWRRRRPDFGLKDLFQVTAPIWPGVNVPERVLEIGTVQNHIGKGRVAYVSDVKPAINKPPAVAMSSKYWKLPENWQGLVDAVEWAAGGQMTLEVEAPLTVTAELQTQQESGKLLLHLINYDVDRTPILKNIKVRLRRREEVKELAVISPDDTPQTLTPTREEGTLAFTLPTLRIYSVVVIS